MFLLGPVPLPSIEGIGLIVQWIYSLIGNYGWTVVIFTVALKLLMLPVDFWQRLAMKKQSAKMTAMQPMIEKIDKAYGDDKQRANEEKSKLYKKQGYSLLSSCLPMILTMAIFFVVFGGLNSYTSNVNIYNYNTMYDVYTTTFTDAKEQGKTSAEAETLAKIAVGKVYSEGITIVIEGKEVTFAPLKEEFLWIKNVWRPDTWVRPMPDFKEFIAGGIGMSKVDESDMGEEGKIIYGKIYQAVLDVQPGYDIFNLGSNGLLILPLLSVGMSFLSTKLTNNTQVKNKNGKDTAVDNKSNPAAQTNKMMLIMMPIMMGYFGILYTSAFAIYMVTNSFLSIISTMLINPIIDKSVIKSLEKAQPKVGYKR